MGDDSVKSGLASILAGDLATDELYRQMGLGARPAGATVTSPSNGGGSRVVAPPPVDKKKADKAAKKKKGGFWGFFGGKEAEEDSTPISGPTNFKREMHIGFNSQTGAFEVLAPSHSQFTLF